MFSCANPGGDGKILTLAMEDEIITLDPYLHDDSITHSILSNIYDPLVGFDKDMKVEPALAIGWENPDDLTWRFYLRPDVTFHNGRALTSRDVKYSLERARQGKVCHYLSTIKEIKVIDKFTLEILTNKPSPVLLNKLTFISIVPEGSENPILKPIGTGAYRFVKYQEGEFIELRANDKYWRGKPKIKRAVFTVIPNESERTQALLDDRVQLIRDIDMKMIKQNRNNPKVEFVSSPGLGVSMLGIDFKTKSPLLNRKVREAIYWAIDPLGAIESSGENALPVDQLVSSYIVGYNPYISADRPNIKRAKKLLMQAGYPSGFTISLEMSQTAALTTGKIIEEQLAKIDIKIKVIARDWPDFSSRLYSRQIPFFLVGWSCSSGDASDLFDACLHSNDNKNYGSANWGDYKNSRLDKLIERSNQILDNKERIEILKKAMKMAMNDFALIPIFARNRTYGYNKNIIFSPRQDGRVKIYEILYKL